LKSFENRDMGSYFNRGATTVRRSWGNDAAAISSKYFKTWSRFGSEFFWTLEASDSSLEAAITSRKSSLYAFFTTIGFILSPAILCEGKDGYSDRSGLFYRFNVLEILF